MSDFTTQKKLLQPLLKDPKNHHCADCNSISPTWVSLDFGVFLCSNCSGAHRSLGPTITRVRSANLDKWQEEWITNMQIGNTELNLYWQNDPKSSDKKPKDGASLNEIGRYVFEKYIKRKFVKDHNQADPLTLYKQGKYQISKSTTDKKVQIKQAQGVIPVETVTPIKNGKTSSVENKTDICLLDFDFQPTPIHKNGQSLSIQQESMLQHPVKALQEEDFTQFVQISSNGLDSKTNHSDLINFDTLLHQQKQPQPHSINQPHHNYNTYHNLNAQNRQPYPLNSQFAPNHFNYTCRYQSQQPTHSINFASMPYGYPPQGLGNGLPVMNGGINW